MRHYQNELSEKHGQVTGFQSACSEFAEKGLSLDERLDIGNPAIFILTANSDDFSLSISKGDKLIVNSSLRPRLNDLIVIEDRILRLKNYREVEDRVISGVVVALLKELVVSHPP